jgi:hypothetical protein
MAAWYKRFQLSRKRQAWADMPHRRDRFGKHTNRMGAENSTPSPLLSVRPGEVIEDGQITSSSTRSCFPERGEMNWVKATRDSRRQLFIYGHRCVCGCGRRRTSPLASPDPSTITILHLMNDAVENFARLVGSWILREAFTTSSFLQSKLTRRSHSLACQVSLSASSTDRSSCILGYIRVFVIFVFHMFFVSLV